MTKKNEQTFLKRLSDALEAANFYSDFDTDWVCLDCELMPWSAKAKGLIQSQYAAVGTAATNALQETVKALEALESRNVEGSSELLDKYKIRERDAAGFVNMYRNYSWPVDTIDDYKLAPFHILATEGKVHTDKPHDWHMQQIHQICSKDLGTLRPTAYSVVDLASLDEVEKATQWWLSMTKAGGEGMVVKPINFVSRDSKGLVQPAIKIRGREYLRIIYGPEYTEPQNLIRLKQRNVNAKRSLALREFATGLEGLQRFIDKEPLRRVHQCAFGVLALESEPVDPRL